jgi:hypothetical protein
MPYPGYTTEGVAERGKEIYEDQIRAKVEAEHHGKFLVVDIESGEYEIAEDDGTATDRLLARKPNGILYGLRIDYLTAYRLGGRFRVTQP